MDKRQYVQRQRAEAAEATRKRILDAAYELLQRGPLQAIAVDEVARTAGVARSTVYVAFGSRAGLFDALADDYLERGGFERLTTAYRDPDVRVALRESLRRSCELYAAMPEVPRALFSLAAIDPDAAAAIQRLDRGRWPGMNNLARRLRDAGALRPDVSLDEAAELLWVITSFASFDQLFHDRGLPLGVVADRLVALAERAVVRADAG